MKARQGYARQEMVGQKIIESASSTSVLFIIRKKYVKFIIYAQGTFSHCAFLKRHVLSNIFSLVLMKARQDKKCQVKRLLKYPYLLLLYLLLGNNM
jgi:hypothetical protein